MVRYANGRTRPKYLLRYTTDLPPLMPLPIFLRDASRLARLCCITAAAALLAGCVTTLPKSDREGPAPVISSQDQQPAPAAAATPDSASPAASDPVAVTETTTAEAAAPALPALPEDLPPVVPKGPLSPLGDTPSLAMGSVTDLAAPADMWDRIRRGLDMPDIDGRLVDGRIKWYVSRPDYIQRMSERAGRYMFYIVEELERRHLPTELALLPFIESAFNPGAVSRTKAVGIWQFMPRTGKSFDLRQNSFRDERQDIVASTNAALDYLESLHTQFGDWHLALAAYNWGQGNVRRAIARNKRAKKPTGYLHLRMPAETRLYIPKLQAVEQIIRNPGAYGLTLPVIPNHPYFEVVNIDSDIDVALVAKLAGIEESAFRALNPALRQPVILANGTPQILLPWDNASEFKLRLAAYNDQLATWTAWIVRRSETPAKIAKRVGMNEKELSKVNNIPPRMIVRKGSTLLIRKKKDSGNDVSARVADNARLALTPQFSKLKIRVKRGDTLSGIASRYGARVSSIMKWNNLKNPRHLRAGQTLIVRVR